MNPEEKKEEERLTVRVQLSVTNSEGKVTLVNDLTLGEMKLPDVLRVEKGLLTSFAGLLEVQG